MRKLIFTLLITVISGATFAARNQAWLTIKTGEKKEGYINKNSLSGLAEIVLFKNENGKESETFKASDIIIAGCDLGWTTFDYLGLNINGTSKLYQIVFSKDNGTMALVMTNIKKYLVKYKGPINYKAISGSPDKYTNPEILDVPMIPEKFRSEAAEFVADKPSVVEMIKAKKFSNSDEDLKYLVGEYCEASN